MALKRRCKSGSERIMENVARLGGRGEGGDRVLYSSPNIIRAMKSEGMIRAGHEKRTGRFS